MDNHRCPPKLCPHCTIIGPGIVKPESLKDKVYNQMPELLKEGIANMNQVPVKAKEKRFVLQVKINEAESCVLPRILTQADCDLILSVAELRDQERYLTFIEVEAIDEHEAFTIEELKSQCDHYFKFFELTKQDVIDRSYCDLIIELKSKQSDG